MQIHELNTFSGTVGDNDYFVTDNGTDTSKINASAIVAPLLAPIESDMSVLEARMDSFTNLAEGSTTGDAELIDGRVGADGVTYTNIGGAIRNQVSDLKSEINYLDSDSFYYVSMEINVTATGYRLNESDGLCTANANYKLVKYLVSAGDVIRVKSDDRFQFQNAASVPSSGTSNRVGITHSIGDGLFVVPSGATHLIISTPINGSVAGAYKIFSKQKDAENNIESVAELNLFNWNNGAMGFVIGSDGTVSSATNGAMTDFIPVDPDTTYIFSGVFDSTAPQYSINNRVHEYNSSKTWISNIATINVPKGTDTAVYRSITFKTSSTTKYLRVSFEIVSAVTNQIIANEDVGGVTAVDKVARQQNEILKNEIKSQIQFNKTRVYQLNGVAWEQGGLGTSTGNEYNTNNAIRTGFMDLLEANYLIARFNATGSFGQWKMFFYKADKTFISPVSYFTTNGEFAQTIPTAAKFVRLHIEYWTSPLTPSDGAWLEYLGVRYNIPGDIPSYFVSNLNSAEESIREHEADCSFNGDALIFLTDTHYSAEYLIDEDIASNAINANHSIPLVLDVIKNTGVRFTAFGGDLLNACDGVDRMMQSISIFNDSFGCNKFRLMSIVGNHEYYTDLDDESFGRPTASQLYGGLIKINEDVILGRDAFNDYYFDNPIQKIRYFMISCGRDTELDNAQAEWFMDELTKVPNGYNIIVIGHAFLLDDMSAFRIQHLNMMEALDAVTARSSYTFNGNTYDYSALQNVTVICVLTGHTHKDGYLLSEGGTLCICTTCDSYKRQGGGITRTIGTVDEQAFDVVQFDFDNRKIYCTRIGYGSDREFSY